MAREIDHFGRKYKGVKRAYRLGGGHNYAKLFQDCVSAINTEIDRLRRLQDSTGSVEKRRSDKSKMVGLVSMKDDLYLRFNRKPPESGIAVPAEPPKGPLPKQGGAEAPLTFH